MKKGKQRNTVTPKVVKVVKAEPTAASATYDALVSAVWLFRKRPDVWLFDVEPLSGNPACR